MRSMKELIELLSSINFDVLNIDELLDSRDSKIFDLEWTRIYKAVEALKNEDNYSESEKTENFDIKETVFKIIYGLTNDCDLAGYVSDDFGLILDAELLEYEDAWLSKLISCYRNKSIPCGIL